MGALTKHGISCPIVGACTWQARYGYVNIMHADICVCFHALRVHHHFRQAALPGRPLRTTNSFPTSHEQLTTKSTSRRPTYPAESRVSLSGCILSHHQVTRFGISDSHGFARRKAPLLTMYYVYITFQAGRPSGRPLRATNYEPLTTNNKKALEFSSAFLQESAASYPPRGPPPKYFRRLRA